jgi:hypothetical protein
VNERIPCEYFLVRYVPDPVKGEFVNIGVLLREAGRPESVLLRFTKDWSRVRCVDPEADTSTLESLEIELRGRLQEAEQPVMKTIGDSFSQQVQMTSARGCLAESMPAHLEQLMQLYVNSRKRESTAQRSGRMAIHARMRSEFERAGVWDLMRKQISVAGYTRRGDPLRIDCGYRANGDIRMFHGVSLVGDTALAKVLAFTAPALTARVKEVDHGELQLTAIVQPRSQAEENEETLAEYDFARDVMEAQNIRVLATSQLPGVAETARRELHL